MHEWVESGCCSDNVVIMLFLMLSRGVALEIICQFCE